MPGKVWTAQEEAQLRALVEANTGVDVIAIQLDKSPKSVITKCQRLGLQLKSEGYANMPFMIPKQLPSVEETAKILAGALKASVQPGLNRVEVQRLQTVANIAKMYKELIVDFAHYNEVEAKLNLVIDQNARLQQALKEIQSSRTEDSAPKPVS